MDGDSYKGILFFHFPVNSLVELESSSRRDTMLLLVHVFSLEIKENSFMTTDETKRTE